MTREQRTQINQVATIHQCPPHGVALLASEMGPARFRGCVSGSRSYVPTQHGRLKNPRPKTTRRRAAETAAMSLDWVV